MAAADILVQQGLFDTLVVRILFLNRLPVGPTKYTRVLCTALRSFFRFLVLCGQTSRDL
jgi:hypothetical protein